LCRTRAGDCCAAVVASTALMSNANRAGKRIGGVDESLQVTGHT
jgi:hypothetical protein